MNTDLKKQEAEIEYLKILLRSAAPLNLQERQDLREKLYALQDDYDRKCAKRTEKIHLILLTVAVTAAVTLAGFVIAGSYHTPRAAQQFIVR